ncbi:MAG TPA: hypothetical protein VHX44_04445 [Planctomycetota bacterium]|nr:hypothetical protein [Planctomycetota bacterium]
MLIVAVLFFAVFHLFSNNVYSYSNDGTLRGGYDVGIVVWNSWTEFLGEFDSQELYGHQTCNQRLRKLADKARDAAFTVKGSRTCETNRISIVVENFRISQISAIISYELHDGMIRGTLVDMDPDAVVIKVEEVVKEDPTQHSPNAQ